MYRLCTLVTIIALSIAVAGCGGGGGGGSASDPTPTVASYAGTWTVLNLGLPRNQMMIGSGGQVFVAGDPPTRSGSSSPYYTRIGTCSSSGNITFAGTWTYSGSAYQILGNGTVSATSHAISMTITLIRDAAVVVQDGAASGSLYSATPPTVPTFPADGTGYDVPPAVPL